MKAENGYKICNILSAIIIGAEGYTLSGAKIPAFSKNVARTKVVHTGNDQFGKELYPEGNFENELPQMTIPQYWIEGNPVPLKVQLDNTISHSGSTSLRLEKAKNAPYDCPELNDGFVELLIPKLEKGKLYKISLWMKADGKGVKAAVAWPMRNKKTVGMWRGWFDPNPRYPDPGGTISPEWVFMEKEIRAVDIEDPRQGKLRLFIGHPQGGSVWFDDISLREIKEDMKKQLGNLIYEDFESGRINALELAFQYCPFCEHGVSEDPVKYGKYSYRIPYDFKSSKSKINALLLDNIYDKSRWVSPLKKLSLWVYGDASGIELSLSHKYRKDTASVKIDWSGWRNLVFDDINWDMYNWWYITLKNPDAKERKGNIYVDEIVAEDVMLDYTKFFTLRTVDENNISVYKSGEKVNLSLRVRNNTREGKKDLNAQYTITDFYGKVIKDGKINVAILSPEAEKNLFEVSFTPDRKGIYYVSLELSYKDLLYWHEQTFAVIEPNKKAPPPKDGGMFFGGAENESYWGHLRSMALSEFLGFNAYPRSRSLMGDGPKDDPYRWSYWDYKTRIYESMGIVDWHCHIGTREANIAHFFDEIKGDAEGIKRLKEVKYFSFFGEYDPPEPKYIRDEKQKNEYARRIKEFSGLSKEITKKLKKLFPDSKLSPYWLVFYNKTDNDGLYVIDWLGETKDFTDFFCYCNVMPRENILNRDNVRKMLFEKAQVDFPVWIAAQRGATETAFPLAYSMGYEYMAPEGDGMVCHYGGYDDVNSISRGHLCDVYGYPNYSYLAMYTVIKMLSGAERKGISRLGQSIYCCKYKKADDYIYYLWSSWYNGENIALSTDADKIILRDIMGNDRTISLNDPDLNLKVSYWPIQLIAKKEIKLK